jgi:transposase
MSEKERERSHVVRQAIECRLSQQEGAERLGIGVRQFKRLVRAWKRDGAAGLVSRQRGQPSHNRLADAQRSRVLALLKEKYEDFGPTLAAEKLLELDGIAVSRETIRQMQIGAELWKPKRRRAKRVFQTRERRPRYGELVQIDGSPHAWFEDRGPCCTLIVFIDDATSRLMALHFVPAETTRAYLEALRAYILTHGRPMALYSDRHGIFRVNAKDAKGGDGKTEFGRVVERLEIGSIQAETPQAKGRVERSNQTLQDRLVKEMRLRNISSIEAGNAFAASYIAFWNKRFAVPPRDAKPAHRPWTATPAALEDALARREERTLSKALTFSSAGTKYCVKTNGPGTALRGAKVTLYHFVGGGMAVHYKDRVLPVTAYGTYPVPDPTEDEKTIDARMDAIVARADARRAKDGRSHGLSVAARLQARRLRRPASRLRGLTPRGGRERGIGADNGS